MFKKGTVLCTAQWLYDIWFFCCLFFSSTSLLLGVTRFLPLSLNWNVWFQLSNGVCLLCVCNDHASILCYNDFVGTVMVKSLHTFVQSKFDSIMNVLKVFWKCDRICWGKNIHIATWSINSGDYRNVCESVQHWSESAH